MESSPYIGQPLRSVEEVMDDLRLGHLELLKDIHGLLNRAETLARKISDEHGGIYGGSQDVHESFEVVADSIHALREGNLLPAERDLREWEKGKD